MESSAHSRIVRERRSLLAFLALLSFMAFLSSGCAERRRPTIPWATAVLVRPASLPPRASTTDETVEPVADVQLEIPALPSPFSTVKSVPARPRVPSAPPVQSSPSPKPEPPAILPELSAQESVALQHETEQSLSTAERNLAASAGKSLNATQADLAAKVRNFIADAREAARAGDWALARTLAKKAQVLSDELVASL